MKVNSDHRSKFSNLINWKEFIIPRLRHCGTAVAVLELTQTTIIPRLRHCGTAVAVDQLLNCIYIGGSLRDRGSKKVLPHNDYDATTHNCHTTATQIRLPHNDNDNDSVERLQNTRPTLCGKTFLLPRSRSDPPKYMQFSN